MLSVLRALPRSVDASGDMPGSQLRGRCPGCLPESSSRTTPLRSARQSLACSRRTGEGLPHPRRDDLHAISVEVSDPMKARPVCAKVPKFMAGDRIRPFAGVVENARKIVNVRQVKAYRPTASRSIVERSRRELFPREVGGLWKDVETHGHVSRQTVIRAGFVRML